jgi:outer membrane murein-binding lipoprotein Lpp
MNKKRALGAGAWDVSQKTTRLDERVTRMAVDVQGATAAIARIDRIEERLTAVGRSVDRIESDVSRTRESVEALRNELATARRGVVAAAAHTTRTFARR